MNYVLDPLLFALDDTISQKRFEDYLQQLTYLGKWQNDNVKKIFVLSNFTDVLVENGFYPFNDKIQNLIKRYNISYYQAIDINRMMGKIIDKANKLDLLCNVGLREFRSIQVKTPNRHVVLNRSKAFVDVLGDMIWYVYLYTNENKCSNKSFDFFLKDTSGIFEIELIYDELIGDKLVSSSAAHTLYCHKGVTDFMKDEHTPIVLWMHAFDKDDLMCGIKASLYQSNSSEDLSKLDIYEFTIQRSFFEDLLSHHYNDSDIVIQESIRAITNALQGSDNRKVHTIRVGRGGNNKDLKSGDFKAFRRELSNGRRIHYWKSGKIFCFANIGEHDEFDISDRIID